MGIWGLVFFHKTISIHRPLLQVGHGMTAHRILSVQFILNIRWLGRYAGLSEELQKIAAAPPLPSVYAVARVCYGEQR